MSKTQDKTNTTEAGSAQDDLCYPVLTPFKWRGIVVRPPAYIQLSAEDAAPLLKMELIGEDAALAPEPENTAIDPVHLVGSSFQGVTFTLDDGSVVTLADVAQKALLDSGLSVDDWFSQPQEVRDEYVQAAIAALRDAANPSETTNTDDDDATAITAAGQQDQASGGEDQSVAGDATELQGAHSAETESQANTGGGDAAAVDQLGEVGEAAPGGQSTAGEAVKDASQEAAAKTSEAAQTTTPAKTTKAAKK